MYFLIRNIVHIGFMRLTLIGRRVRRLIWSITSERNSQAAFRSVSGLKQSRSGSRSWDDQDKFLLWEWCLKQWNISWRSTKMMTEVSKYHVILKSNSCYRLDFGTFGHLVRQIQLIQAGAKKTEIAWNWLFSNTVQILSPGDRSISQQTCTQGLTRSFSTHLSELVC